MATLLASMLIGAGHAAMVVSGVAREETVMNDQHNDVYPYEIEDEEKVEVKQKKKKDDVDEKYKLRPLPDLESHLEEDMAALHAQRAVEQRLHELEVLRQQIHVRTHDIYSDISHYICIISTFRRWKLYLWIDIIIDGHTPGSRSSIMPLGVSSQKSLTLTNLEIQWRRLQVRYLLSPQRVGFVKQAAGSMSWWTLCGMTTTTM